MTTTKMKTNQFSNATLNTVTTVMAQEEMKAMLSEMHENAKHVPYTEVAQCHLMSELEMTQTESEAVCNDILKGIADFDEQFKANLDNGKVELSAKLKEMTASMDEPTRKNYLSGVCTAMHVAANHGMEKAEVEELLKTNASRTDEELIADIEASFNNNVDVENLANFTAENVDSEAITKLAHALAGNKNEARFFTATLLYVEQRKGTVKLSDDGGHISAYLLGSLASASAEAVIATGELKEGKIGLKRWQTILKFLLGSLLVCALGYLALMAAAWISVGIIGGFIMLFGNGILTLIASGIVITFVGCYLFSLSLDGYDKLITFLSNAYDRYIEPITQIVKSWWTAAKQWWHDTVNAIVGYEEHTTTVNEPVAEPVVEPAQTNNAAVQQGLVNA